MDWAKAANQASKQTPDAFIEALREHVRPCTCHPDDWPQHIPCQRRFAFKECAIEAIRSDLARIK